MAREQTLPSAEETEYWAKWNSWCEAHIANALEAEREFQRDVVAQALAEERNKLRTELRGAFEAEVKALDARIGDLHTLISTLLHREPPAARERGGEFKFAHERDAAEVTDLPKFLAPVMHKTTVN